jgi:uncharacterized protein YdeI (YjbR/CyaY-like superfamily)
VLVVADAAAWRAWLDEHEGTSDGVWLTLARKDAVDAGRGPTTLRYAAALDEALCSGWVDGQARGGDADTYGQRFTPRRVRSLWSARNVTYVARLREEGRMRPRGEAEVARAQADGRWDRAYAGPATMAVPDDLRAALDAEPALADAFAALGGQDRYAACHRVVTATTPAVRARRVAAVLDGLRAGTSDGA